MKTPNEFIEELKKQTKIDIFQKARQTEIIQYRCLCTFVLRNHYNMRFIDITDLYKKNGLSFRNANILNSYKKFISYKKINNKLALDYDTILKKLNNSMDLKRAMLIEEIKYATPKEINAFQDLYDRKLLKNVSKILI
jgi:hypothetical protein